MSNPRTDRQKLTVATIRQYVGALPAISKIVPLDKHSAQAVRFILEQSDSAWESRLKVQVDHVVHDLIPQLDYDSKSGRYAITGMELRGIVAQALSQGSGQTAVDIGQALSAPSLAAQFAVLDTDESDNKVLAENYKQPELQQGF